MPGHTKVNSAICRIWKIRVARGFPERIGDPAKPIAAGVCGGFAGRSAGGDASTGREPFGGDNFRELREFGGRSAAGLRAGARRLVLGCPWGAETVGRRKWVVFRFGRSGFVRIRDRRFVGNGFVGVKWSRVSGVRRNRPGHQSCLQEQRVGVERVALE
jgi:hypothetical protein